VNGLLFNAFRALGPAATRREVATVATALRESGDKELGELLNYVENREGYKRCLEIADEAGAYGFVALDLALAFREPRVFAKLIPPESTGLVD
jgi:hypothetical protein